MQLFAGCLKAKFITEKWQRKIVKKTNGILGHLGTLILLIYI